MKKLFEQIVKFGIVGAIAFVIDYAVLFVLVQFLHMDSIIAATISFTVSVIFNYLASMKYVFVGRADQSKQTQFIIFIVLSKYIDSVLGMFILNALWLLGIGFIKLNILLIDHLLNVLFIPNSLKTLEKELVIGCIEYNSGLKFKYRLKREMFNI